MSQSPPPPLRSPFVGTWTLVSQHNHYPDGRVEPSRGKGAIGVLMYDAGGNMAVQLMRTDERATAYTDLTDLQTAMEGYLGYFGTYIVNEVAGTITHYVAGASFVGYRDSVQHRAFAFSDDSDSLQLTAQSPVDGSQRVLLWARVAGTRSR